MDVPRSRGCVTQAAKQLALPPNQNGYLTCSLSHFFFRESSLLASFDNLSAGIVSIDLLWSFRVTVQRRYEAGWGCKRRVGEEWGSAVSRVDPALKTKGKFHENLVWTRPALSGGFDLKQSPGDLR